MKIHMKMFSRIFSKVAFSSNSTDNAPCLHVRAQHASSSFTAGNRARHSVQHDLEDTKPKSRCRDGNRKLPHSSILASLLSFSSFLVTRRLVPNRSIVIPLSYNLFPLLEIICVKNNTFV